MSKIYEKRDEQALDAEGGYFTRHVEAMGEHWLNKDAIAAELAFRDSQIDKLRLEVIKLEKHLGHLSAAQHLNATKIFEAGPLEAALARIEELEAELSDWQRYCAIIMREHKEQKGA